MCRPARVSTNKRMADLSIAVLKSDIHTNHSATKLISKLWVLVRNLK